MNGKTGILRSKFKEYYILNIKFTHPETYVIVIMTGAAAGLMSNGGGFFGLLLTAAWIFCLPDVFKICSRTLYQKEAYFYQSFPVTAFQTVLAKTLICTQLMQAGPVAFFATKLVTTGELYGLEKGGMMSIILGFIGLEAFYFGVGGIFLIGFHFGNGFRNLKKGRPGTAASVIFIGIMLAGDLLVLSRETLNALDNMTAVALSTIGLVLEAMLFLWINKEVLRKYYSM